MMCLPPGLEYGEGHVISPTGEILPSIGIRLVQLKARFVNRCELT
jgi:hypothetical protein